MKLNKIINWMLMVVASLMGIYLGIVKIIDGDTYGAFIRLSIVPVMFAPFILNKLFHYKIGPKLESVYLVFVFCAHFLGSVLNFYHEFTGYDKLMHLISGSVSALVGLYALVKFNQYNKKHLCFHLLFVLAFTLMIAGLWEIYEFTGDQLFGKDAQNVLTTGVKDTMQDMIAATIGSVLIMIMYVHEMLSKSNWFITKFLKESHEI